jgi:hypothetical protein
MKRFTVASGGDAVTTANTKNSFAVVRRVDVVGKVCFVQKFAGKVDVVGGADVAGKDNAVGRVDVACRADVTGQVDVVGRVYVD